MKIGLLLPSALMYDLLSDGKIFAPKELFIDLARELVMRGHKVRVYTSSDESLQGLDVITGEVGLILSEPSAMKLRYTNEKAKRLIAKNQARWEYEMDLTSLAYADARQGKIEIIHSFLEFASHYFAKATGVPTVYTVHDPLPDKQYLDYWRYLRFPTDNYIAISKFQSDLLSKIVSVKGVAYNGVDPSKFIFSDLPGDYLLFVGRYMPEKGVEDALKAGIASKTLTVLAGSKEYKRLPYFQNQILPYLSNKLVKDIGFMNTKQKNSLFGGARALLMPIHWDEPFGMVMIEAMACGTPVIAYNRGSVSEVVQDGITGYIVDEDDRERPNSGKWIIKKRGIEGLVEAIKRIDEIKRENCRKRVEDNFTTVKMADNYEKIYQKVIDGKK